MRKHVPIVLACFLLLVSSIPLSPHAGTASTAPSRVISLVYDDSGSMYGSTKWASTNYAMQAFTGLLNDNDELYVTYLSDYTANTTDQARKRSLATGQRQATIDAIRNFPGLAITSTPFAAVIAAADLLKRLPVRANTEYWLVVLTDGIFTDLNKNTSAGPLLAQLQESVKADGKDCKLMYLAIGSDAIPLSSNEAKGFYAAVTNERDITATMASMASVISGTAQAGTNALVFNGASLTISSSLPIRSMKILTQKQTPTLRTHNGGDRLLVGETNSLSYPAEIPKGPTDKRLVGRIVNISPEAKSALAAGTITLTFSEALDPRGTVVLFEPALAMAVAFTRDGKDIPPTDISPGDDITAQIRILDEVTGATISLASLPSPPDYAITLRDGNGREQSTAGDTLRFTASAGTLDINALASLPGYFELRSFHHTQVRNVELIIDKPSGWSGALANLKTISPLTAHVLVDGRPATSEELAKMHITASSQRRLKFGVERRGTEGSFLVRPKYNLLKLLTPAGKIPVVLTLNTGRPGENIAQSVNLSLADMPLHQKVLPPLLLMACSFLAAGFITKPRFDRHNTHIEHWVERPMGDGVIDKSRTRRFEPEPKSRVIPYVSETASVGSLEFTAGKTKDHILLPKRAQHKKMRITGIGLLGDNAGSEDIVITPGTVIEVPKGDKIEKYRFRT